MLPDLTNLLPPERVNALSREYALRFATLALIFVGVLLIAHAVLLIPAYSYVTGQKGVQEKRVAELSERREVSGFTDLSTRVAAFSAKAEALQGLNAVPAGSDTVRAILALPRAGIRLTSFVYTAPHGSDAGTLRISGTAADRSSLRAFDGALSGLSFVRSTDLPLSAYARESEIPFSITLTLDFATP